MIVTVKCHNCDGKGEKRRAATDERGRPVLRNFACRPCRGTGRLPVEFRYRYSMTIGVGEVRGRSPGVETLPDTAAIISGEFNGYEPMTPAELRAAIAEELHAAAVESAVGFSC